MQNNDTGIEIEAECFNSVFLPYLEDDTELQIFLGGGGSGKSKFVAQRTALDLWRGERNLLIARKVAATIRASVYTELKKAVHGFDPEFAACFDFSLEPMMITCLETGFVAMFAGLDDVEKIKSITPPKGVFTDLWVEEATEATRDDIDQLTIRLRGKSKVKKRRTLTFNPVHNRHWIAKDFCTGLADDAKVYREPGMSILRTTYLDNRFLAPDDIEKYERYREINPNFYRVYGLGLWGSLGAVIFTKWAVATFDIDQFGQLYHGIDFGFAADPTAIVSVALRGDDVYICREYVAQQMTNRDIFDIANPIIGRAPVSCDCAEPKSISELQSLGLNAYACTKGPDSVMHRIQWMLNKRVHIHPSCKIAAHEFSVMEWAKDRSGESINRPTDKDNHVFDALCYALDKIITNKNIPSLSYGRLDF
jgi:phage terminase large subunit